MIRQSTAASRVATEAAVAGVFAFAHVPEDEGAAVCVVDLLAGPKRMFYRRLERFSSSRSSAGRGPRPWCAGAAPPYGVRTIFSASWRS